MGHPLKALLEVRTQQCLRGHEQADRGIMAFISAELQRSLSFMGSMPAAARAQTEMEPTDGELCAQLARLNLPILIVHGQQDRLVPLSNSRRLATMLPSATLVEYKDCGHCPQEEQPARLSATVRAFL